MTLVTDPNGVDFDVSDFGALAYYRREPGFVVHDGVSAPLVDAPDVPAWEASRQYVQGQTVSVADGLAVALSDHISGSSYATDLAAGKWLEVLSAAKSSATYPGVVSVAGFGAKGDGTTDDTSAIQDAIDLCTAAGGGIVWFPHGTYKASGLTASGAVGFAGAGGADHRGGTHATGNKACALTPATAGSAVLTVSSSERFAIWGIDFVHDRSFAADALVLGSAPGSGIGTFWPDLNVAMSGFLGHGLKIIGTVWEADLRNVHVRRCGDGANDKAAVEIDCTNSASDADTIRFHGPNVVFPQAVGFRMKSAANSASTTSPGFRRLVIDGGIFHAGTDEDNTATKYDADMIVLDGFTSAKVVDVNVAAVAGGRYAINLDGTLTTNGSNRATIEGCQLAGPVRVGFCKDVTIKPCTWTYFAPGSGFTEHVKIESTATRTTVEPQSIVNDGPLVVTDAGTNTVHPLQQTVWVPATAFAASSGSPTLSRVGSRYPAWLMHSAVDNQLNASAMIPPDWRRFDIELVWANNSALTGNIKWSITWQAHVAGDDLTTGDASTGSQIVAASAQNIQAKTVMSTGRTATSYGNAVYNFRVLRNGADTTNDTLAGDVGLVGLRLRRAA